MPAAAPRLRPNRRWLLLPFLIAAAYLLRGRPRSIEAPPYRAEWLLAGDTRVRALRGGQGDTTLVFLHGYSESLLAFRPLIDRFAPRFKVVALDLPGFGVSDKPAGPYHLDAMRRRLADFLARETTGPLVLVGHSMGGELAAALALSDTTRVRALVLIAPAGYALTPLFDSLSEREKGLLGLVTSATGYVLPVHDPAWLAEPADRLSYDPFADSAHRAVSTRVLEEFDFGALRTEYARLKQPTLLIWGRQDPTIPFAVGEQIAAALRCVEFAPLDRALHRPHQATPDTIAALMDRFFSRGAHCPVATE